MIEVCVRADDILDGLIGHDLFGFCHHRDSATFALRRFNQDDIVLKFHSEGSICRQERSNQINTVRKLLRICRTLSSSSRGSSPTAAPASPAASLRNLNIHWRI